MKGPRFVYLHGFASSPGSAKARAFAAWFHARAEALDVLDLRVPSFEHLRFSAMKSRVHEAIDAAGGARARVVLVGSSLGGLLASRVAEEDARVSGLFLMAPAFRLAERWRARLGEEGWARWRAEDALDVDDYATKSKATVDFGFAEELERLDGRPGTEAAWPDIRVPTRIVHGIRDDVVAVELSRTFAAKRPHVRLVEVDDGHELGASIQHILSEAEDFLAPFGVCV